MESKETHKYLEEAKKKLGFFIKNEAKRKFVGETYSYLIRIPDIIFWVVALVTIFIVQTVELIVVGVLRPTQSVTYGDLLLGFIIAVVVGLIIGSIYRKKVSKKIHTQIGDILKFKTQKQETPKDPEV